MIWWWFVVVVFSSTLCLQVGNRLVFCGGCSCFVSFIWCQLFACLIMAANFRLLPAFVVWYFFLCHRHLWSVLCFFATGICVQSLFFTAFSAVGIRVRLFVFALLALVSWFRLWSKSHWTLVFRHKVYVIALSQVLATQMGVTEPQHQSQLVWIVQIWPIFASQRVDSAGIRA